MYLNRYLNFLSDVELLSYAQGRLSEKRWQKLTKVFTIILNFDITSPGNNIHEIL